MIKRLKFLIISSLLFTIITQSVYTAPKVKLTLSPGYKGWTVTVGQADLTGGAGSDFASEYESPVNETDLDISNSAGNWRVDVRKQDINWHADIHLYVQRTSDGTGTGTISGGSVYQEVTNIDTVFFSGTGDRTVVTLQFRVSGSYASLGIPIDTYETTITYTVTDSL